MTFREFLQRTKFDPLSASADFAGDARADKQMRDFESWDQLRSYLLIRCACPEAVEAARTVWRRYQRSLQKHRGGA